jgi:hypothetical protein
MAMMKKVILAIEAATLVAGMLMFQGCFFEDEGPGPGYGYYGGGPAVVYGDWDERHEWHPRDWWVGHREEWVEHHHPNWLAFREHHGHDRD